MFKDLNQTTRISYYCLHQYNVEVNIGRNKKSQGRLESTFHPIIGGHDCMQVGAWGQLVAMND